MTENIGEIVFLLFLLYVSITDYRCGLIYDKCLLTFFIPGILLSFGGVLLPFNEAVLGALMGGGVFALIRVLSRGGMGGGDVKLSFVLGFWLGAELYLVAMYIAFILGTLAATVLYLRRAGKHTRLPFAPCMSAGALVARTWGEEIINFYLATAF